MLVVPLCEGAVPHVLMNKFLQQCFSNNMLEDLNYTHVVGLSSEKCNTRLAHAANYSNYQQQTTLMGIYLHSIHSCLFTSSNKLGKY